MNLMQIGKPVELLHICALLFGPTRLRKALTTFYVLRPEQKKRFLLTCMQLIKVI